MSTDILSYIMIGAAFVLLVLALIVYLRRFWQGPNSEDPQNGTSLPPGNHFHLAIRQYARQPGSEVNDVSRHISGRG